VESVDPKDLVLLAFVRQNTRRLTVGQVREQAKIKRGLSSVLEELRSIGLVHYSLEGTSGQMTDDIMVSRCGAIHLPYDYKLVVLAPDETEVKLRDRETAWQLLVYGTPEPRDATRGFLYPATLSERGFCSSAQNVLYNVVSSTIVDENWTTLVKPELERLYQEYMARR